MRSLIAALLFFFAPPAQAQSPRVATDAVLAEIASPAEPGLAVGVWSKGETVYRGTRGQADLGHALPLDTRTRFHLASLSKAMTGRLILQLADQGKLDLDADVRTYLPDLPRFGSPVPLRDMLHMQSGLKDYFVLARYAGWGWADWLPQTLIPRLLAAEPTLDFAPGSAFTYSNTNYALLAEVAAKVSGRSFADLSGAMFAELGMGGAGIKDDAFVEIPAAARSYWREAPGRAWQHDILSFGVFGATGAYASLEDMLDWGIGLAASPRLGFARLAEPGRFRDGSINSYGAGMVRGKLGGLDMIGHGGADASFRNHILYLPQRDLGVVVLANRDIDAYAVATRVARLWAGLPAPVKPEASGAVSPDWYGSYEGGHSRSAILIREGKDGTVEVRASPDAFFLGGPPAHLGQPLSRDVLGLAGGAVTLRFLRDGQGQVSGIEERNLLNPLARTTRRWHRLQTPTYDARELATFAGTYRSASLDRSYRIGVIGGELMLSDVVWPGQQSLTVTGPDRFELWDYAFRTLEFRRERGRVVALVISADRATQVCFARLPDKVLSKGGHC